MDREILFRGKRLDNGEWVEGYLIRGARSYIAASDDVGYMVVSVSGMASVQLHKVDPSTVGQYTGLTDKNGVKIFEGDIVAAGYYKWKCQVVWDEECARFICYTFEEERRIVYVDMTEKDGKSAIEVIGNVHDNPELIGGEDDG